MQSKSWSPDSWKKKSALFQPQYENSVRYKDICEKIASHPPLVFPGEIENLKKQIAQATSGEAFILQGGDCVERFQDCREEIIQEKVKIILQMSVILVHALQKPVVRIGRIAGQYYKPRSKETETINGKEMLTYRGDALHRFDPSEEGRRSDPERLLDAFYHSGVTLNYIRSLVDGGFADLHSLYKWKLSGFEKNEKWDEYREVAERILDAINFMETFGGINRDRLTRADFYTSHEGLHLGYEEAVTKRNTQTGKYYNSSAHLIWIGERTRMRDGGHVEYCRGIENPIGIKFGPNAKPDELIRLLDILNPDNKNGKIVIITRLGAEKAENKSKELSEILKKEGRRCAWVCDPMHENTTYTSSQIKTRSFDDILEEIKGTYSGLNSVGVPLAGVHFEMTGEDVTECTGGAEGLKHEDLGKNYTTYCDPRLNYVQSLEMAFLLSRLMKST